MNILIVGEFSGFARHLKNGFKKLGHKVTIVMAPDSFKNLTAEVDDILYGNNITLFGKTIKGSARFLSPLRAIRVRMKLAKLYKRCYPDLIIVINPAFVSTSFFKQGTPLSFLKRQLNLGAKMILSECGSTPADCFNHIDFWKQRGREIVLDNEQYSFLLQNSHVIIPTIYGYFENLIAYSTYYNFDTKKIHYAIPLPITVDKEVKIIPCEGRKIVVFHGIIRPKDKGTSFILDAMKRLEEEMPNRVECIAKGGIPYNEYVKLFDRIDILVDQTYGNGWGMNALIGAMKGKCVLAPCGPENSDNMRISGIPFVQIIPDSNYIYKVLRELILNPNLIDTIKHSSRKFASECCECSKIAKQYLGALQEVIA